MKNLYFLLVFVLFLGCSKSDNPVTSNPVTPPTINYLYQKAGIIDSIIFNTNNSDSLGFFDLATGNKDSVVIEFKIKTNSDNASIMFLGKYNYLSFYYELSGFSSDGNYNAYKFTKKNSKSNDYVYMYLYANTANRYIVMKDLSIYLK